MLISGGNLWVEEMWVDLIFSLKSPKINLRGNNIKGNYTLKLSKIRRTSKSRLCFSTSYFHVAGFDARVIT